MLRKVNETMLIDPKIKNDFIEVIKYSQNIEDPKVDGILKTWASSKATIIKEILHNKLIYRVPEKLTFVLNAEAKTQRFETFTEYVANLLTQ